MYNCLVKPTLEDGLGALREATELAKSIRIDLDAEYLRAIATVEGLPQNQSGSWGISSTSGEGLLYIDGDLNLTGPFTYKGLIYIEGNLASSGHIWVLGAIVARGRSGVQLTGGANVLYSEEAIGLAISKFSGQFVTLSWREK